jgi:predicted metal-dependent hydrolase
MTPTTTAPTGGDPGARMTVRQVQFSYPTAMPAHWNPGTPEFSHIVNAGSLAMPYLEPYLIKTMRAARPLITDPALQADLDSYVRQEATHYKQHRMFNDELKARPGYREVIDAIEARLQREYAALENERSLAFNVGYAEGFECTALAVGQMLVADREYLFGNSESGVASLVLWHFVEEIEHKNVTYDVFEHLHGNYFRRAYGVLFALTHIFALTRSAYKALLEADGLWRNWRSRIALAKLLVRIFRQLIPKVLRILTPGYNPRQVSDPSWALAWAAMFERDRSPLRLDTRRLDAPEPIALQSGIPG